MGWCFSLVRTLWTCPFLFLCLTRWTTANDHIMSMSSPTGGHLPLSPINGQDYRHEFNVELDDADEFIQHEEIPRQKREFEFFGMKFDDLPLPPMIATTGLLNNNNFGGLQGNNGPFGNIGPFGNNGPMGNNGPTSNGNGKGYAKLDWKHCGNKNDAIVLRDIEMNPNPIQVPGKVLISFNMEVKENQTAPIRLRMDMKKKIPMLFGIHTWMPVPCYNNGIGSCVIEDICNYEKITFGQSCPRELIEQNITCKCPLLQGNYTVPPIEQEVPRPPSDIDPILMEGEFRVKFTMYKGYKRLTCYETNATIRL